MYSTAQPGAMSRLAGESLRFAGVMLEVAEAAPLLGPAIRAVRVRTVEAADAARLWAGATVRTVLGAVIREVVDVLTEEVDLTDLVLQNVDLERLIAAVLEVIDLVDLHEVIGKVDLDEVAKRIDLDAIAARIDIDAILGRVDLVGLAEEIIDGVDLPDIIREASTSVTADVMTDVRSSSERADDAVANAVNRFLRRRGADADVSTRDGADG
ncbi:hypothetical protein [Gordonia paraffinivorans]|uniref:hypothetical protein n=1 Tax=Gordonia paraffinivorans TaxID=175628 RepID=UPI0021B17CAA|nr:hypothetical protein [Gordonia paraffinivorans]